MSNISREVTIRKFEAADTAAACELFEEGMLAYAGPEVPAKIAAHMRKWSADRKVKFFSDVSSNLDAHNGGCMFVAVNNAAEIVGTVALRVSERNMDDNSAELLRMSVRGAERRCGIGKQLLDYAVAYCRDTLKRKSLLLITGEYMEMAVKFYLKNGFTIDPDYRYVMSGYEPGEADFVKLRLSLET